MAKDATGLDNLSEHQQHFMLFQVSSGETRRAKGGTSRSKNSLRYGA
jgi:hypothetical protein